MTLQEEDRLKEIRDLEYLLRQLNYAMNQKTRAYLAELGLSLPRFWVLAALGHCGPMIMGDLQRQLCVAPSTLTGLVDGLEAAGLVQRERGEEDRRVVYLRLATAGEEQLARVMAYKESLLARAVQHLDTGTVREVKQSLASIYESLEEEIAVGRPPCCPK